MIYIHLVFTHIMLAYKVLPVHDMLNMTRYDAIPFQTISAHIFFSGCCKLVASGFTVRGSTVWMLPNNHTALLYSTQKALKNNSLGVQILYRRLIVIQLQLLPSYQKETYQGNSQLVGTSLHIEYSDSARDLGYWVLGIMLLHYQS